MKLILSYIFYFLGDKISYLLKYDWCVDFVYPIYSWLMTKSSDLDINNKLWKKAEK